jgi:hypothetical protein
MCQYGMHYLFEILQNKDDQEEIRYHAHTSKLIHRAVRVVPAYVHITFAICSKWNAYIVFLVVWY